MQGTTKLNLIREIKNYSTREGQAVNRLAKDLKTEGFKKIYQRKIDSRTALQGQNKAGDTRTYLISQMRCLVKTVKNSITPDNKKIREIDKAVLNEYGNEISGTNKIQNIASDGKIINTKITKRGWNA